MIKFIECLEGTNWENDVIIARKVNEIIEYLNKKEQENNNGKDNCRISRRF